MSESGSPAHAGIVPSKTGTETDADGFPRTRGDSPPHCQLTILPFTVPPHTRG